jgi:hypothetical protein
MMDGWFSAALGLAIVLRGIGAGTIIGLGLMMIPTTRMIGVKKQAEYQAAMYRGPGVRVYAAATVTGTALTGILAWWVGAEIGWTPLTWLLIASFTASALGFVGTGFSLSAMRGLWSAVEAGESADKFVSRFSKWHVYSASCHGVAFSLIAIAGVL